MDFCDTKGSGSEGSGFIKNSIFGVCKAFAIFGTFDRFTAYLIEETKGAFPVWLSPKQAVIIPVHFEKQADYAYEVAEALKAKGVRVHVDSRNEKLGYKIREAQMNKIPYQLVVGDNEVESGKFQVTVRETGEKVDMTVDELISEINEKTIGKPYRRLPLPKDISTRINFQ